MWSEPTCILKIWLGSGMSRHRNRTCRRPLAVRRRTGPRLNRILVSSCRIQRRILRIDRRFGMGQPIAATGISRGRRNRKRQQYDQTGGGNNARHDGQLNKEAHQRWYCPTPPVSKCRPPDFATFVPFIGAKEDHRWVCPSWRGRRDDRRRPFRRSQRYDRRSDRRLSIFTASRGRRAGIGRPSRRPTSIGRSSQQSLAARPLVFEWKKRIYTHSKHCCGLHVIL